MAASIHIFLTPQKIDPFGEICEFNRLPLSLVSLKNQYDLSQLSPGVKLYPRVNILKRVMAYVVRN